MTASSKRIWRATIFSRWLHDRGEDKVLSKHDDKTIGLDIFFPISREIKWTSY
jgi:hypothetical protein